MSKMVFVVKSKLFMNEFEGSTIHLKYKVSSIKEFVFFFLLNQFWGKLSRTIALLPVVGRTLFFAQLQLLCLMLFLRIFAALTRKRRYNFNSNCSFCCFVTFIRIKEFSLRWWKFAVHHRPVEKKKVNVTWALLVRLSITNLLCRNNWTTCISSI